MSRYSPLTAQRLRESLNNKNMSAQELSELSGVGKSSISQYLSGKYTPKNVAAAKMGRVLGVAPEWLMGTDTFQKEETPSVSREIQKLDRRKDDAKLTSAIELLMRMNEHITDNKLATEDLQLLNAFHQADPNTQDLIKRVLEIKDK